MIRFSFLLLFISLISFTSHASLLKVYDTKGKRLVQLSFNAIPGETSVMTMTRQVLENANASFLLNEHKDFLEAIQGLGNTPDLRQELSLNMRAYGWCYRVDGKETELPPCKMIIGGSSTIEWFYGYVIRTNGVWQKGCIPAWQ